MRKLLLSALQLALVITCYSSNAEGVDVLGIGNAAVDVVIPIEESFLANIVANKGCAINVGWDTFSLLPEPQEIASGGSSANTIKGLAKLGKAAAFFGKTGKDKMGDFFAERLLAHNVKPILLRTETPNMQVACLVTPDGQRSMLIFQGAGLELSEDDLDASLLAEAELVHTDGYLLENRNLFAETLRMAKAMGKLVSVDLGCTEIMAAHKEIVLELLSEYADIVFGNKAEIEALTGMELQAGLETLRHRCPLIVAKVGEEGCWVATKEHLFHSPSVPKETIVDTTGAGDLFAAGFLYGYLNGCPLRECARYGNILGGAAIEGYGAEIPETRWVVIREQLRTP